ncbi:MAG: N-acetyl sugar amidotransferase [Caulobacteraceae bacterium]|nr:N-acetyl sugar amidotransferase [Caulobacteraceae bacterium]
MTGVVAGAPVDQGPAAGWHRCSATVMDTSDSEITFDDQGVSNHARIADWRWRNEVFHGQDAETRLSTWVERIRRDGRGKDYDCIIGLSGGVDSSVVACRVVDLGLRPLAVHLDNGWNSELAVSNVERIVKRLGIDLFTHVVDWDEIKDLQRSYFKASVMDLECVSDHAINTILLRIANRYGIGYVVHGGNVATESILPRSWAYDKRDGANVKAIHRAYGERPLRTYPIMQPVELAYRLLLRRIIFFPILNYVEFKKSEALEELVTRLGWRPYGRKHGENRFTRFFQEYFLVRKFGIDKRKAHLSSLIVSGQITREEAILELEHPLYKDGEAEEELAFVAKKLDFSVEELSGLIEAPRRDHTDFPNVSWMFDHTSGLTQLIRYFAKGELSLGTLKKAWRAGSTPDG